MELTTTQIVRSTPPVNSKSIAHSSEQCGSMTIRDAPFPHGRTAGERPCRIVESPVTIEDLHATIYSAMGIAAVLYYEGWQG